MSGTLHVAVLSATDPAVDAEIAACTAAHPAAEVEAALDARSVPYSRILTAADIAVDPHYAARSTIQRVHAPTLGREVPMAAPAPRFSRTPGRIAGAGPALGADTRWALREWAEMPDAEIDDLLAAGVVAGDGAS